VLELLTVRQLVAPGSKWHLHRRWFLSSAMDQLLEEDFSVAAKNRLYECLDRIDRTGPICSRICKALEGPLRGHLRPSAL